MVSSQKPVVKTKALILDLDGTLLDSSKQVPAANAEAVLRLQSRGDVLVAFATARPPYATFPLLGELGKDCHVICYNGAVIFERMQPVASTLIPVEAVRTVIKRVSQEFPGLGFGLEHNGELHAVGHFDRHFPREYRAGLAPSELPVAPTPKILIDIPTPAHAAPLQALIPDTCGTVLTDKGALLQVMAKGVSKRSAVESLLQSYSIHWADTMCFGDDLNDMELFRACGTSVAMGNAHAELAGIATHRTLSNDDNGVAHALNRLLP